MSPSISASRNQARKPLRRIGDLLSPSYFVQAQIFPYNYQHVAVRGNATKIDALFLREYLHQRHTIPQFGEPRAFCPAGTQTCFREGIVRNVWHCDVQSLYPSLMLAFDIKPRGDELNLFLPLLRDLRQFRLKAKAAARQARESAPVAQAESDETPLRSVAATSLPVAVKDSPKNLQAGTPAPPEHYEALQLEPSRFSSIHSMATSVSHKRTSVISVRLKRSPLKVEKPSRQCSIGCRNVARR